MLDKKDLEILDLLQFNAATPVVDLAEMVSLSPTACWARIKKLEKSGIITKKVVILDRNLIGLDLVAFVLIKTQSHTAEWYKSFIVLIKDMPEVLSFFRTAGEYDYILKVTVEDMKSYDIFYKKLINKANGIKDVTTIFAMEEFKATTQLPIKKSNQTKCKKI
jgi:Lrp/AsnC family transcriptional regulator